MEVIDPYFRFGMRGAIDGVYIEPSSQIEMVTKYYYNEWGELFKEEVFSGDSLLYENSYTYKSFENHGKSARLLTQSIIDGVIYDLEYEFY